MKSLFIAILTFIGLTMFAPQAEARTRYVSRHYSHGHSGHYSHGRYGHYGHSYRSYYPRYYGSSYYYSGYYPRYRYYGYYPSVGYGYCGPRYYRPGVTLAFHF